MRRFILLLSLAVLSASCGDRDGDFTARERRIIHESDSVMYVTVIDNPLDSVILRTPSTMMSDRALKSEEFRTLCEKMLSTVQSPEQDGVGISAPQVGINRRLVCVLRYDKPGQPFEAYPNILIEELFGEVSSGPEGCLSIPSKRGLVPRYSGVIISWTDPETLVQKRDTVRGYTAIIFQHEHDHLDGILYTDRADTVFTSAEMAAERAAFESAGAYRRPAYLD